MKEGEVRILSRSTFRQWANHQPFTRAISVLVKSKCIIIQSPWLLFLQLTCLICHSSIPSSPFGTPMIFKATSPLFAFWKKLNRPWPYEVSCPEIHRLRRTGNAVAGYFWLVGCPKTPKMSILQPTEVETSKSKMASKSLDIHFWHALKKGDYDRFHHRLGADSTNSKVNDPRLLQQLGRPFGCRGCRRLRCCVAVCRGATRAVTVCP